MSVQRTKGKSLRPGMIRSKLAPYFLMRWSRFRMLQIMHFVAIRRSSRSSHPYQTAAQPGDNPHRFPWPPFRFDPRRMKRVPACITDWSMKPPPM